MRYMDLNEGPNDPNIFKAIFLAGGPGSGKSFVVSQLGLTAMGLRIINSDDVFEYLMRKGNLSFDMPSHEQPKRDVARSRAKQLTSKKQDLYLSGRLGLIIDGTAKDPNKMAKIKTELESIGYQTIMIFVNASLRTALTRNNLRPRRVPSDIVIKSHELVQRNKIILNNIFGENYFELFNEEGGNFREVSQFINKFLKKPVTAQARDWISQMRLQRTVKEQTGNQPTVYVDMDGVLANFYAGITAHTGHAQPRDMAFQDMEDAMASLKGTDFFYTLPKYAQADRLISMVNAATGGNWHILSSPLKYDREGSTKHKEEWVRKNLKIQPKGMHFTGNKAQYATQPDGTPNILIDDYPQYLKKWTDAGGIGVKYKGHVGNIQDVEAVLDQYFGETMAETIRKVKGGYRLLSKKGKNLGTYNSKSGAEQRERQVQYFKHMNEEITPSALAEIEKYADRLFGTLGIDVNFTKHFLDRVNDVRNVKPITTSELTRLFKQVYKRWGKPIARLGPDAEAVMRDMQTDINMPFLLTWNNQSKELDLIAKTVMRKEKFFTPDPVFAVENGVTENFADGKKPSRVAESGANLNQIIQDFVNDPIGQKYKEHDCKTVSRAFVTWAEQNNISAQVISLAPPSAEFLQKNPQFKGKSGDGNGHIMPVVNGNAIDFTIRQFGVNRPFSNPLVTPLSQMKSSYGKFGYFTDAPNWFLGGKTHWIGPLKSIPADIFHQNFGDELLENFADGKKPGRKGLAKRMGVDCSKSETALRKVAKRSTGEKQRMAHWCANMKNDRNNKK
jgi:predicted kinase